MQKAKEAIQKIREAVILKIKNLLSTDDVFLIDNRIIYCDTIKRIEPDGSLSCYISYGGNLRPTSIDHMPVESLVELLKILQDKEKYFVGNRTISRTVVLTIGKIKMTKIVVPLIIEFNVEQLSQDDAEHLVCDYLITGSLGSEIIDALQPHVLGMKIINDSEVFNLFLDRAKNLKSKIFGNKQILNIIGDDAEILKLFFDRSESLKSKLFEKG